VITKPRPAQITPHPVVTPAGTCSHEGHNCMIGKCCADPGMGCYVKDPGWSSCRRGCEPGMIDSGEAPHLRTPWNCTELRPGRESGIPRCSDRGQDCAGTACCNDPALTCFEKHPRWATCKKDCARGIDPSESAEAQTPWSCRVRSRADAHAAGEGTDVGPSLRPPGAEPALRPSLYCFALMLPHSYEVSLLRAQVRNTAGIFDCNEYAVLSNADVELSPGPPQVRTRVFEGSLKCEYGGEYHTALNSEIFMRVWTRLFRDGAYAKHDWTVKVDPDTVFLPGRLRKRLKASDPESVVYMNNCDAGLHGPIEVISAGGMRAYREGFQKCLDSLRWEWSSVGEDVFVRHCLGMLGVNRVDDFGLLREKACEPFKDPMPCLSGSVAFHPLKNADDWFTCYSQAQGLLSA